MSADVVRKTEGRVATLNARAWRAELAGVEERGMPPGGFPRNLGDLLVSAPTDRVGPRWNSPGIADRTLAVHRSAARVAARYGRVKATKRGGMDEQESEHSRVPWKRGHAPERTPGRECRIMDPVEGQMTEAPTSERIATQLHRIATGAANP